MGYEETEGRLTGVGDHPVPVRHTKESNGGTRKKRKKTACSNSVSNGSEVECEDNLNKSDGGTNFTSVETNKTEYSGYGKSPTDAEWSDRLYHFLTCIPHGVRHGVMEPPKAKSVITQIKALTSFQGLYHNPLKKNVFVGKKVDFCSNLKELIEEAKQYENSYDSLQYPLRKMLDFKEYCMQD